MAPANPSLGSINDILGVAYDDRNGYLYVATPTGGATTNGIMVVNATTGADVTLIYNPDTTPVGGSLPVTFDPLNGLVYVSNTGTFSSPGRSLTVINATSNTVVATIPTGVAPAGVAVDSRDGELYVADNQAYNPSYAWSSLTVINGTTNQPVATVNTTSACAGPWALAYDAVNGYLYVAQDWNGGLCWFDTGTNTLVGSIGLNTFPKMSWMTLDPADGYVYAVTQGHPTTPQSELYILDPATSALLTRVNLPITMGNLSGANLPGIGYDPWTQEVLVFGQDFAALPGTEAYLHSTVLVFNGTALAGTFYAADPSGPSPTGTLSFFAYDSASGDGLISASAAGTLSVVAPNMPLAPAISPPSAVLLENTGQTFSASTSCLDGPCAASPTWSLNNSLGTLNTTQGPIVDFSAGTTPGDVLITSNVALHGYNQSTSAPVRIHPALSAALQPAHPDTDVNVTITLQALVSGGSGAPYTYTYTESSPSAGCSPSSGSQVVCTPTAVGSFFVQVNVTDNTGERAAALSPTVTVGPMLHVTFAVSSNSPLLGQTVAFVANVTGGISPYAYNYTGFPPGCVSIDVPAVGCLPTQAGFYNVTVHATDSYAITVTANVTVHVIFDFNVVVPTNTSVGSPFTISVNTNETFSASALSLSAQGGFGAFTYDYAGLPPGCSSQDAPSLTCTPSATGRYFITISVHDQVGDHNTHTVVVNVLPGVLGLPGILGYAVIGAIAAVLAAVVVFLVVRARREKRGPGRPKDPDADEPSPSQGRPGP